jgi:hypothetical protein
MEWRNEGGRGSNESSLARSAWENRKERTVPMAKGTIDPVVAPGLPAPGKDIAGGGLILFLDGASC